MSRLDQIEQLSLLPESDYRRFLPIVSSVTTDPVPTNIWDIPYTIGQLSYLTHSHYRYYGKFPSAVAGLILDKHFVPGRNHCVLDNFCGSGTTLVEAKLRGIPSFGVDISWKSALASNVKTRHVDLARIKKLLATLDNHPRRRESFEGDDFAIKWFTSTAYSDLKHVQRWLGELMSSPETDFLVVAFLAIIRRVSRAHDAEVRPHVNPSKRERPVLEAYRKKVGEMLENQEAFQKITQKDLPAFCATGSNISLHGLLPGKMRPTLIVSHPPYLNSFNYRPVYSLEFYWGRAFESVYNPEQVDVARELIAHPANDRVTLDYFAHFTKCYEASFDIQPSNSKLAIVVGDCTRNGKLIPVIEKTIELCENVGYTLNELNFRTTHYGLGKYAYKHRADYHGSSNEKRDAIIVLTKRSPHAKGARKISN